MTDTNKWRKGFIKSLPSAYKLFWLYLTDECDHAGIWHVEMDIAKIRTGEDLNKEDALKLFESKIIPFDRGEKWFLPDFIDFQYGELKPGNRAHDSVISLLSKYNLIEKIKGHTSPLQGDKDMDKDKDKDKDILSYKDFIQIFNQMTGSNFKGDASAKRHFDARIKDGYTLEQFQTAIHNCLSDEFHQKNPNYLTPEFITRPDKIEKYLNYKKVKSKLDNYHDRFNEAEAALTGKARSEA